jgi:ubiquinone/menaquinone biosynthesis C-methylase UbiE
MNTLMTSGRDPAWQVAVAEQVLAGARLVLDVGTGTAKLAQAIGRRRALGSVVIVAGTRN